MARTCSKAAHQALLQALACGATVESAARRAGVSERTAYRRLDDPAFVAHLNRLRAEMVQRTTAMLSSAGLAAVKTLVDLQQESIAATVRRGAARDVLELGMKYREVAELAQRVTALERRLSATPAAGTPPDAA